MAEGLWLCRIGICLLDHIWCDLVINFRRGLSRLYNRELYDDSGGVSVDHSDADF